MPGGDRTGPMGMGQMTGWGRGYCGGSAWPSPERGFSGGLGRGFGGGRGGGGRGWRHCYRATGVPGWSRGGWIGPAHAGPGPQPATEEQHLEQRCELLESELEAIKRRLDELGAAETE